LRQSFLSFSDLSPLELDRVFQRIKKIKQKIELHERINSLSGKIIALLFEKPSTRTSAGFEVAALRLGGHSLYFSSHDLQLSRGEPIKDTARVLGADVDAIVARVFSHETLVQLAKYSGIPVINALSDLEHPTQVVSDLFTLTEAKKCKLSTLTLAYIGDGNNVCNSLLLGAASTGMNMVACCPKSYEPDKEILSRAEKLAHQTNSVLKVNHNPMEAVKGADVLYTDVWVSMGEEKESRRRMEDFKHFQINSKILSNAKQDAVVMHCLPAHRGLEITDEVMEGGQSIVWRQAENKQHGAAGVLEYFMQKPKSGET
jgi:ornithine carbamoyltransferase